MTTASAAGAHHLPMHAPTSPPPYDPSSARTGASPAGFALPAGLDGNVAAQMGLAYGAQALEVGQSYLQRNVNRYISVPQLRYYFDVNNAYVGQKVLLVLFPFRNKVREIVQFTLRGDTIKDA